jgi:hypothetical protein
MQERGAGRLRASRRLVLVRSGHLRKPSETLVRRAALETLRLHKMDETTINEPERHANPDDPRVREAIFTTFRVAVSSYTEPDVFETSNADERCSKEQ